MNADNGEYAGQSGSSRRGWRCPRRVRRTFNAGGCIGRRHALSTPGFNLHRVLASTPPVTNKRSTARLIGKGFLDIPLASSFSHCGTAKPANVNEYSRRRLKKGAEMAATWQIVRDRLRIWTMETQAFFSDQVPTTPAPPLQRLPSHDRRCPGATAGRVTSGPDRVFVGTPHKGPARAAVNRQCMAPRP